MTQQQRHAIPDFDPWCVVACAGNVMGDLNRRKGVIMDSATNGDDAVIQAEVPLNNMFGYSTVLRSNTQVAVERGCSAGAGSASKKEGGGGGRERVCVLGGGGGVRV